MSLGAASRDQRLLAPYVRTLSETLADLAQQPGDRAARQSAADNSLGGMRQLDTEHDEELAAARTTARIAVTDLMLFVGADPQQVEAATTGSSRTSGR